MALADATNRIKQKGATVGGGLADEGKRKRGIEQRSYYRRSLGDPKAAGQAGGVFGTPSDKSEILFQCSSLHALPLGSLNPRSPPPPPAPHAVCNDNRGFLHVYFVNTCTITQICINNTNTRTTLCCVNKSRAPGVNKNFHHQSTHTAPVIHLAYYHRRRHHSTTPPTNTTSREKSPQTHREKKGLPTNPTITTITTTPTISRQAP